MFFGSKQSTFNYFDITSSILTFCIATLGLIFIFSATYSPAVPFSIFFKKQCFGYVTGILIYIVCTYTDYRTCMRWGYFGYVAVIGLLFFTLFKGSVGMGAQRWIDLAIIKVQPSELAKLFFPAFTSYLMYHHQNDEKKISSFIPILFILALSFILIRKQPDLGTALVILFSGLLLCWLAHISTNFFRYGGLIVILAAPLCWHILKPYQKQRIIVFFGYGDEKKERYQIEQAIIAIGSGGLWGKGLLQGTQNKFHFLPEGRTDFIFAVLCEEWGFFGACLLILLYFLLFWRLFFIVKKVTHEPLQLFALGTIMHIILSTLINIGMVLGLLPIVGIPLPLMSYGISNLWITCASLGLFQNSTMQRIYRAE